MLPFKNRNFERERLVTTLYRYLHWHLSFCLEILDRKLSLTALNSDRADRLNRRYADWQVTELTESQQNVSLAGW